MSTLVIILIILLLIGVPGGWHYGGDRGPYIGGGLGLILLVLIILALLGRI
jgi:hypothetical protein